MLAVPVPAAKRLGIDIGATPGFLADDPDHAYRNAN